MQQVLFRIPIHTSWFPDGIPLYGYGMMLFLAFLLCTWVAGSRAEREGIRERIQDMAIWLFLFGIAERLTYLIQEPLSLAETARLFFRLWDGGLVFYGGMLGGVVGFFVAYRTVIKKHHLSGWKMGDIIAPCIALGLCLGRLGCYLNGCCYGNVACPDCQFQAHFPLSAPPRFELIRPGYQTTAGFTLSEISPDRRTVGAVDPASAAAAGGLKAGDLIVGVNGNKTESIVELEDALVYDWPRGKNDLRLSVKRGDQVVEIGPFKPLTIGLHPTQLYSSVGGFLIFCLLTAYSPLKRRDGEVVVLLLLTYPLIRFLEECLRNDTRPYDLAGWWPTMTLSQNISIGIFALGLMLAAFVWRRPVTRPAGLI